jgi:hypothetical protein
MGRIGRLAVAAEVLQKPFDDRWFLDTGNDLELPAAAPADLDVDGEDALEALGPGQRPLPVGSQWLAGLHRLAGSSHARFGHDPGPVRARRREHTVIPRQMGTGFLHQRDESGDEVFRLKDHVRGAVPIRRLQCQAYEPALGQRQPFSRDRGSCDIARQVLELLALRGLRGDPRVQRDKIAGSEFGQPKAGPKGAGQDARSNPELSATSLVAGTGTNRKRPSPSRR